MDRPVRIEMDPEARARVVQALADAMRCIDNLTATRDSLAAAFLDVVEPQQHEQDLPPLTTLPHDPPFTGGNGKGNTREAVGKGTAVNNACKSEGKGKNGAARTNAIPKHVETLSILQ